MKRPGIVALLAALAWIGVLVFPAARLPLAYYGAALAVLAYLEARQL